MAFRFPAWLAGVALVALALAGCNKLKLGYEYADWLLVYSVEDNFDLDKPQRAVLKEEVNAYFQWHRKQMLPAYSEFLNFVADSVRNGLRPSEIDSGFQRYKRLYRSTLQPIPEKSLGLLMSLTPEQVDSWLERQRKKNAKLRKDFSGSLEDRLDHRYQKIVDEMEDWTGRLNKEQKNRIKALNRTLPWNGFLWLDTRERFQTHLADQLKKKAPKEEVRASLNQYLLENDSLKSEEYRARNKEFELRLRTLIHSVHGVLTTEQKRHFIRQVEKTARDFETLSRQN
jgi:predicted HicB family RNase H-like nuclease